MQERSAAERGKAAANPIAPAARTPTPETPDTHTPAMPDTHARTSDTQTRTPAISDNRIPTPATPVARTPDAPGNHTQTRTPDTRIHTPAMPAPRTHTPAAPDGIDPPRTPGPKGLLLPGVAGICMFLLLLALLNTFAALKGIYGLGGGRYGVLAVCTLLVVGIFGQLRMRRWGWAIVTSGSLLLAAGYLYVFSRTHAPPAIVQSLFGMVFFLYLVRTEVRERLT